MNAFSDGVDALFGDANMAADALYTPMIGDAVTVRAVRTAPDEIDSFGAAAFQSDTVLLDVRVSDVSAPVAGDTITFEGEDRIVQGVPVRDDHRTVWTLDTRPA